MSSPMITQLLFVTTYEYCTERVIGSRSGLVRHHAMTLFAYYGNFHSIYASIYLQFFSVNPLAIFGSIPSFVMMAVTPQNPKHHG